MEFLRKVFTNLIFEKFLSHEALVTGRVTAASSNLYKQSNARLCGAINEINSSSDVGSYHSFRSKFFARSVSCFKSFSRIAYAFANFSTALLIEIFDLRVKELKCRKELPLDHYKMSLQSSMRLQDMCRWLKTEATTSCKRCFKVIRDTKQQNTGLQQGRNEGRKGGAISRAPNHCRVRCMTPGDADKSQQCHTYFLQYNTLPSERHQVQTWGRQTCFLPRAPSNLVTPLTYSQDKFG